MRRFLLAAVAALSFSQPALADAATNRWIDDAVTTLRHGGVSTVVRDNCQPGYMAYYQPADRVLAICPLARFYGPAMVQESIAHEAIHAAQHCAGRWMGVKHMIPLGTYYMNRVPAGDPGLETFFKLMAHTYATRRLVINRSTAGGSELLRLMEIEAYAYEIRPDTAMDIFAEFCVRHRR